MVDDWGFGADEKTGWVWLDDTRENAAWYEALVAIDARDDKQPLIKLLQSGQKVPPSIAFYIGDLLARYAAEAAKVTAAPACLSTHTRADQFDRRRDRGASAGASG